MDMMRMRWLVVAAAMGLGLAAAAARAGDGAAGLDAGLHLDAGTMLASADPAPGGAADLKSAGGSGGEAAAKPADDSDSIALKLQNPVADLISVPIQFNWDTGIGPNDDKDKITINIQPVIPIHITPEWNLISRTILPVVYAESPINGINSDFGLGDTLQSLFLSPRDPVDGWILGAGPAMLIPTGTDDLFRSKQFALGPTGVALRQDKLGDGTLTWGILANHLWKVAGSDEVPSVNATFLQPFIVYTLKGGSSFMLNSETTYDWSSEQWSVPLNAGFSQLIMVGKHPLQLQFGGRYYVDTVPNGPEWGLRMTVTFLFPN